jgi:hypothetical protein
VREGVPELSPFVNRAGRLGGCMARDAAREGELPEQHPQTLLVTAAVRVELAVRPLEIGVGNDGRPTVPGAGHVDNVEVAPSDRAVEVRVDEVEPWGRAEVAEQAGFHVFRAERLSQERIVEQVDLAD